MLDRIIIVVLPIPVTIQAALGLPVILKGNKAERRYNNLYLSVPAISAYDELKRQGCDFHSGEKLFEAFGEGEEETESPSWEFLAEADPELMEYVGGGKARSGEETAAPAPKEDNSELEVCPLCGSLNPIAAKSCDFCGAELPETDGRS